MMWLVSVIITVLGVVLWRMLSLPTNPYFRAETQNRRHSLARFSVHLWAASY